MPTVGSADVTGAKLGRLETMVGTQVERNCGDVWSRARETHGTGAGHSALRAAHVTERASLAAAAGARNAVSEMALLRNAQRRRKAGFSCFTSPTG